MRAAHGGGSGVHPEVLFGLEALTSGIERDVQLTVRGWCDDRVRPEIAGWYEVGHVPARELAAELGRLGVLGMTMEGYGGAGLNATAYGLVCHELEAADSGIRSLVSVQGSLAMHAIHAYGSDEQRDQWLPQMAKGEAIGCFGLTEPDHGSDPGGMRTFAQRDGADWVLNGTKTWITNGSVADVAVVWAQSDQGVRGFLVPSGTPGFSTTEITRKLSLRASVTAELALQDVRLPGEAALPGANGLSGPLACLDEARFGIVFGALGAARDCLETALDYAESRTVFGRQLNTFQLTQLKLSDMALEWGKGMVLALHLGRLKEGSGVTTEQVSLGKLNSAREALAIARQCRTILGASGISGEYPVLRHASNLESVLTYEGTSEIHTLVLGRLITGVSAFR